MISDYYNKLAYVYGSTYSTNQIGEQQKSLSLIGTAKCRINKNGGSNQILGDNRNTNLNARIYMAPREDFAEWDYILLDNIRWTIKNAYIVYDGVSQHHLEIDVYEELQK